MESLIDSWVTWVVAGVAVLALVFAGSHIVGRLARPRKRPSLQDAFLESLLALAAGRDRFAEARLAQAVEDSPADAQQFLIYGALLLRRGSPQRAARIFEGLLARRDLEAALTLYTEEILVEALLRAKRDEDAASRAMRLDEAVGLDADRLEKRTRLAMAARVYDVAQDLSSRLERMDKPRGQALQALCFAAQAEDLVDAGRADDATKLVKKALARSKELAAAWALEGQLFMESGKLNKARQSFAEALRLEPGFGLAVFPALEDAHIEHGQVADFEAMIHKQLEDRPREPVALWALGSHFIRRRHLQQGATLLQEAVEVAPDFTQAQRELARARAEIDGSAAPIEIRPLDAQTLCQSCGTYGVRGIVRCPVCGQVGLIEFVGVDSAPAIAVHADKAEAK